MVDDREPARGAGEEREYLLGTDEAERVRLGFQHQVWAEPTARAWEQGGFGPGQTLLDVGCGPGYASFDLAARVGRHGRVIAVDISQRFLEHLRTQARARGVAQIEAVHADVEQLDLPPASVDGAFARWVLCFAADPEAVVRGVARALRPGGRFVVLDYAHYEAFTIAPRREPVERVIRATAASMRARGGNPDIGRELPALVRRHGLEVVHLEPVVRAARPGSALWEWPASFFAHYTATLVEMGLLRAAEADEFHAEWRRLSADPAAYFFTPPLVALVAAKP